MDRQQRRKALRIEAFAKVVERHSDLPRKARRKIACVWARDAWRYMLKREESILEAIRLEEVEFWKLRARAEEAARAQQEAELTPQALEAVQAGRRAAETLDALAEKYGFDRALAMTFDEATCSITPVSPQTPPK